MYLIPLNQLESVALVVHALRAAGGEADCGGCPARRVCQKQCLAIAAAIERMLADGALPALAATSAEEAPPPAPSGGGRPGLKVIK